jgi:hypothetical protein
MLTIKQARKLLAEVDQLEDDAYVRALLDVQQNIFNLIDADTPDDQMVNLLSESIGERIDEKTIRF